MASGMYQEGLLQIFNGTIDLDTDTVKLMLLSSEYTYDPDHDQVSDLTAGSGEVSATNYTGGFNGSGRKTATVTMQVNDTSNRLDIALGDLTWDNLGGAANDVVQGAALIREVSADSDSIPIAWFEFSAPFTTNGSSVSIDFLALGSGGNIRISV